VGVYYGSLIPGRTTQQEFLAGSIKEHKAFGSGIFGNSFFRDGSGNNIILLEQFFRQAGDFNYLLGIQKPLEEYNADTVTDDIKESGSYAVTEFAPPNIEKKSKDN